VLEGNTTPPTTETGSPTIDLLSLTGTAQAAAFYRWLQGPGRLLVPVCISPDGQTYGATFLPSKDAATKAWLDERLRTHNLYFHVNAIGKPPASGKTKKEDMTFAIGLHADTDPRPADGDARTNKRLLLEHRKEERARILAKLRAYKPAPTFIIDSGNGYQAFWLFHEPIALTEETIRAVEERNHTLMLDLEGDKGTYNIDRIMRLPGTRNWPSVKKKEKGRCKAPTVLLAEDFHPERRIGLEDVRPTPIVKEKSAGERVKAKVNPANARHIELDELPSGVSDRIKAVIVKGEDPLEPNKYPSRSEALFAVCCALVRAGCDDDMIYAVITDPEYKISESVLDKGSKSESYAKRQIEQARAAPEPETADAQPEPDAPLLSPADPRPSARLFVKLKRPTLVRYNGDYFEYSGAAYSELEDDTIKSEVWDFLEHAKARGGNGPVPFRPDTKKVGNVYQALQALVHHDRNLMQPPMWLRGGEDRPPAQEFVALQNGLLHMPTGEFLPPTADFFTRNALCFDYDEEAPTPSLWLKFLNQLWPNEPDAIATLREIFGYILSLDTSQQKIFLLKGPPRSGKGTILHVLKALVGEPNCAAPTLASLPETFGRMSLIGKQLAVITDASLGPKADHSRIAEELRAISGEDPRSIPRKYKDDWFGRIGARFVIMANSLPELRDPTGALASRFLVIQMKQSFLGREDPTLKEKLLTELPGIFNWSLLGWRELRKRGRFLQPKSSQETQEEFEVMSSPVPAFVRECCVLEKQAKIAKDALYNEWEKWRAEMGELYLDNKRFGSALRDKHPEIGTTRPWVGKQRVWHYTGIRLITVEEREKAEALSKAEDEKPQSDAQGDLGLAQPQLPKEKAPF
jgi:P4 family phage/plasmid primase-like protien